MRKVFKISGIFISVIVLILVFMLLFPFVFREKFASIVRNTARKSLKTEMNFKKMDVSFFHHFPKLTLSLTDFYLFSSPPYTKDTLVSARDISFSLNLLSVFRGPIRISGVYLERGRVLMKYNEKGKGNFDVFVTSADTAAPDTKAGGTADLKIESISFVNTDFVYADYSVPMQANLYGINYKGNSDITNNIFRLKSKIRIDSASFSYAGTDYMKSKPVQAELETVVNLKSLDVKFQKNDLVIKDVPFEFRGELNFRKNGYGLFLSVYSNYQNEWISGSVNLIGSDQLWISVKTDISLRLENWTKRLGIKDYDLKGLFALKLNAQGYYVADSVIRSIPDFALTSSLGSGYFKMASLPRAIEDISFNLKADSKDHDYRKISMSVEDFRASFLKNNITGYFRINGLEDLPVDSRITTSVNLAEISQVFPLDSLQLGGILDLDATVQGKYAPEKKLFPVSNVRIKLKDGSLLTRYYPRPLEQINLDLLVTNKNGKISGTSVKIEDLSFLFEKNPFHLKASLNNPDNLLYDVTAKGNLDLAGIYKMFSQEGMELSGSLTADLHLKGSQKDAMEGRIDRLNNKGTLGLKNIAFRSQYLPHDLILKKGSFRFDNDKIWFEHFDSRCGSSAIMLDGNLGNVVNYFLGKKQVLRGNLNFTSAFVDIRDFMTESSPAGSTTPATSSPGVIIIPPEFDINLKADLRKVKFESNFLDSLTANIQVDTGMIVLKNMQFSMIGCRVNMDASYASTSARKAFFEFHVKAENFDVQRAYREIEMFRNLASSAEKCEGIISIDYQLKGRLINDMEPVYPSLEGNGVITLAKVKVMGLRLFTDMSKNLGREKLKSPDLSKVELKTTIRNNIITLEQTKMKISGFRLKISGESSFDGKLNLKTRVGLPPLGILGIPIRILGTSDNPKFKYGRGNNDEQLEESQYSDELPAEFMDRLKNVKEEEDDGTDR